MSSSRDRNFILISINMKMKNNKIVLETLFSRVSSLKTIYEYIYEYLHQEVDNFQ